MQCTVYWLRKDGKKLAVHAVKLTAIRAYLVYSRRRPNGIPADEARLLVDGQELFWMEGAQVMRIERGGILVCGFERSLSQDNYASSKRQAWWCVPERP